MKQLNIVNQHHQIAPLISLTPAKNMIMYQLKPFKSYIYYTNKQLDDMHTAVKYLIIITLYL